jgi:tripartite ATP-independent transporter DctP family solute receptor
MRLVTALRAAACATAIFCGLAAPALAATQIKIGWTTADTPKDPYATAAHEFAAALGKVAPGEFEVQFFPNRQLGDEKEMLEGLSFGTLDAAIITNAVIANIEPAFQLNDMPFLYADETQAYSVLDGEVGQELMAKLEEKGIVGFGWAEGGFRHMINNAKPVTTPADVEGVKYRVMQNPVFVEMFRSLGGNAVPMAWGEVYTAVQQGTVDGLEIPVAVVAANKYAEVTKYLSLTKHTYSAIGVLMSKKTFDGLSDEQQAQVREAAHMAIGEQRKQSQANTADIITSLKEAGMAVNEVENPAAFRALVGPVYEQFKPKIGEALFDKALMAVE